jgi:uncharacterized protein YoxC
MTQFSVYEMESELDLIKKTLNVLYNRVSEMEKEIETLKKKNDELDDDLEDDGNTEK